MEEATNLNYNPLSPLVSDPPDTSSHQPPTSIPQSDDLKSASARRAFFAAGLLATTALLNDEKPAEAQTAGAYDATAGWKNAETRLARRITYGINLEEVARAKKLGYDAYLEQQLNPGSIDDSAVDAYVKQNYPTLTMSPKELHDFTATTGNGGTANNELVQAMLFRASFSKRQLYQRMAEFWSDHFNIDVHKARYHKLPDDLNVIRTHALGKFPEMLLASASSPAMLISLDNAQSGKAHPNQNYAREVMELHTLSVNGGYIQQDIVEVARCFTGWTLHYDATLPEYGTFYFNSKNHDNGKKIVLGHPISENGGINDGVAVLKILSEDKNTANFISTKMSKFLLGYSPSKAVVDAVTQVYLKTGGDIKSMIREILKKSNLMKSSAKYKRPIHLAVSAIRASGATISDWGSVRSSLSRMGQYPFDWSPPNGYPDALPYWSGLLLPRWDYLAKIAQNGLGAKVHVDVSALVAAKTPDKIAQLIDEALFGGELPAATLAQIKSWLKPEKPGGAITEGVIRETLALALSTLNFQWF